MKCVFQVGDVVVCVTKAWMRSLTGVTPIESPTYGNPYVVKSVKPALGLVYLEIQGFSDLYRHDGFRPAQKTDITIFTEMLQDAEVHC